MKCAKNFRKIIKNAKKLLKNNLKVDKTFQNNMNFVKNS